MNKIQEILLELEGKLNYADATGNTKAKKELIRIQDALRNLQVDKDLCDSCKNSFERCGCRPETMIEGRVVTCKSHKKKKNEI